MPVARTLECAKPVVSCFRAGSLGYSVLTESKACRVCESRNPPPKWPSITLTGPRQSGKTTLCRALFPQHQFRSLEAPDVRAFAAEDPRAFLAQFPRGAVLHEIQRVPDLLSYLQGIIDADPAPGRWILTGSQDLSLLESVSQSLAGRTAVHKLFPLTRGETVRFPWHPETLEETLFTGSYPRIFDEGCDASDWLGSCIATCIDRDVRMISNVGDLTAFQHFVTLCAGRTAELLNYSSLAGDCGISQPTARAWLGILETSFITFRMPTFRSNFRKRLVKMPKLHFHDSGLVCWLLGIRNPDQLQAHPLRGPIFETWVVSQIAKHRSNRGETGGISFHRDRNGAEGRSRSRESEWHHDHRRQVLQDSILQPAARCQARAGAPCPIDPRMLRDGRLRRR